MILEVDMNTINQIIQYFNFALIGIILLCGLIGFFIIIISFKSIKNKISKKDMLCNISIVFEEGKVDINAIIDTGNFLKEPLTGKPVIIVEKDILKTVIPVNILENMQEIINGTKEIEEKYISKIRLIPFTALGTENGLLLGIKPEKFYINYQGKIVENKKVIVGVYNKKLSRNNKYNALVGLDIIK
jgi:stage II sporulation protein GA (sporulation sigma-E factor processing peptidase)